jgi:6-phosphogluconolactonase
VIPLVSEAADYKAAGAQPMRCSQDHHWPLDLCLLGVGERRPCRFDLPRPRL